MTSKKNWRQSPEWIAIVSALAAGFLTHLFAMVTSQFNYDNMTYKLELEMELSSAAGC